MKTAIWILSVAVLALGAVVIWQMSIIKKLTPATPGATREGDGAAPFGETVKAFQEQAREITITVK